MIIWYVHGAGASARSFAWLRQHLSEFPAESFNYALNEPMTEVAARCTATIEADGRPAIVVGHSLGGVVAMVCAAATNVERVVSICAPFGGVRMADMMAMFISHPLVQDLRSYSPLLTSLRQRLVVKPHLAIVGSSGLPFVREPNDGVVTVASQTALPGARYEMVDLNHFEVLMSDDVAELIRKFSTEVL